MKNIIYCIFVWSILFCSCNTADVLDDSTLVRNQSFSKRVKFSSAEDFFNTGITLDTMKTQGIKNWIQKQDFNSLFNIEESTIVEELKNTRFLKVILNVNSEFQLNDTIIWYHKGKFYGVPYEEKSLLEKIKKNPNNYKEIGEIEIRKDVIPLTKMQMGFNNIGGSYQEEFWSTTYLGKPQVTHFKYVQELVTTSGRLNNFTTSFLYLDIKLEWKGRQSWKEASEIRIINAELDCNCSVVGMTGFSPFHLSINTEQSGNLRILLMKCTAVIIKGGAQAIWLVDIRGHIHHQLKGDSHAYTLNGRLW